MLIAVGILAVLALGVTMLLATAHGRATTGRLTRETRSRDREAAMTTVAAKVGIARSSEVVTENPRARADEARRALMPRPTVPEPAGERSVTVWQPADLEELGITRRQFFNRSLLAGLSLGVGAFGIASLAFLWPSESGGFGGKVQVGSVSDVQSAFDKKEPYYNAAAKAYLVAYPTADLPKARKVPAYTAPILAGMTEGYVALYQKCPHLGCRVPWCQTSQWFECPCHGSKYNRVGEKRGGPAPRGMDRFPFTISGGNVTVDTGIIVLGPPIGTDTTTQSPEGPLCV